ncbi:MAG: thiol reductant ABC exporter subunit CydC [Leucobacter sp.]
MSQHRDIASLAMPHRKPRALGLLLGVASDLSMVLLLVLSMWLILRAGEQPPILHLTFAVVGVRALAIGRAVFRYLERLATHNSALQQLSTLRAHVFEQLIPLVPGGLREQRTGDVHARLIDDIDQLQDQPLRVWQPLMVSGSTVIVGILIVSLMSPLAGLVNLTLAVLAVLGTGALVRRSGRHNRSQLANIRGRLVDALIERFEADAVLHAFGVTEQANERVAEVSREYVREQQRGAGLSGIVSACMTLFAGVATLLTISLLRPDAGFDTVSAPVLAAAIIVPAALFEVLTQVPQALQARQLVAESAERIGTLLGAEIPPEIPRETAPMRAPAEMPRDGTQPLIVVKNLSARYPDAQQYTIEHLSFTLAAGQTLLITGESGAGKSTLARVLVRFLEYDGTYRLRGVEAKELPLSRVRENVGLCEQAPHLFDSDLRQNLKFARPEASDEDLLRVLDRVGLRAWAQQREGLDTRVGEHGALVSGGQAGRIALARVLLADFPIVILDEPTAGVDPENADAMMRDMLGAVPNDRVVIVISHTDLPSDVRADEQMQHIVL